MTSIPEDIANQVEEILRRLRENGYRVTHVRRAIVEVLSVAHSHVSARELIDAVRRQLPSVGRASVFRTLHLLVEQGFVYASARAGHTTSYVLSPSGSQHHLVCTKCGAVVVFHECPAGTLEQALAKRHGFDVAGHRLEVFGRCANCR